MKNEVEMVNNALRGDTEAFRYLVEAYQHAVYMVVLSSVRDEIQAQDLTQETFIQAYINLEQLRDPAKVRAWLCGIARNITCKWLDRHRPTESLENLLEHDWLGPELAEALPDEMLYKQEIRECLWQAIYSLPESFREVLLLFYMRDMKRRELADFLGITEAAVRNRLHKARNLLKEVLLKMSERTIQNAKLPHDFTDKVIAEAMKQGESYLQQKHWEKAKQAFLRAVDAQQDYAPAYRGIGLAARGEVQEQLQNTPGVFDRALLDEAIEELSRAFRLGDSSPETVWPLTWALRRVSDMNGIIETLKKYADNAPDIEQEFLALHYVVDNYSLLHQSQEAVEWHRKLLDRMRGKLPPEKLLGSLSDATMLGSWKNCGLLSEWMSISNQLYLKLEDTYDACAPRAYYLRTLIEAVYVPDERFEEALDTCGKLKLLVEKYIEQWVEARWFLTDVRGDLLSIYHRTGCKDKEKQIVADGRQFLLDYEDWIAEISAFGSDRTAVYTDHLGKEEVWALHKLHQQVYYQFALHDFACMCMWTDHYTDAVELFEKALTLRNDAETHLFLAGSILKATGDREKSFEHFRQAIEDPFFSRRHELKQVFLGDINFEDVWDDEQFMGVIDQEVQRQVQQAEL